MIMINNKKKTIIGNLICTLLILPVFLTITSCSKTKIPKDKKDYFQIDRRKLLKTKGDMKSVGDAIMQYVLSNGKAPDISDISELQNMNFPYFARLGNLHDAWNNKLLYQVDPDDNSTFYLASAGKDGDFEGWEQNGVYNITEVKHYNKDVIYSNGGFIYTSN